MRRGRKIFRPKRRYKIRRHNENAIKIITGVAAVAVLVFVGYSAAGPISRYLEERANRTETEDWSVEDTPEAVTDNVFSEAETAPLPTEESVTLPVTDDTASAVTTEAFTERVTEITTAAELRESGAAYTIDPEALSDMESLEAALDEVRSSGASAVILPVKTEGGYFRYATALPFVKTVTDGNDPICSELTAKEIVKAVRNKGLRPIALVSVLYDNNRYGDYRDGSYRCADDDSTWLDGSPDKGGKPWLSPFDETAQDYLCDIMRELGGAGFKEIICDDFIFPEFRSSDIEMLGEEVSVYNDRHKALTRLACMMTDAGEESGAKVMLRITANSIIKGYSELFYPAELDGCSIAVDFSENNISSTMISGDNEIILDDMTEKERIMSVFAEVTDQCGSMKTVPMLERSSMPADDFAEAVEALSSIGYDTYYVY